MNDFGNKVKTAPKKSSKDEQKVITFCEKLINEAAMDDADRDLVKILQTHLLDMIENSYNPLIEELVEQMVP